MNRKHGSNFFGFTVFLTVIASVLAMIFLAACPHDTFGDVERISAPEANPPEGVVALGAEITLTCATPGVSIYYTLDGSAPSMSNGTLYDETAKPRTFMGTFKAIAVKSDMADSPVFEAVYTGNVTSTPTASPGAGDVIMGRPITLSCLGGAVIYYTTNGDTPAAAAGGSTLVYDETAKPLTFTGTLKAIAVGQGLSASEVLEVTYTEYTAPAWNAAVSAEFYNDSIFCTAYGDGKFVAGTYASILNYSVDGGGTWNLAAYPLFTGPLSIYGIAYGNNTFVAAGVYGNIAFASSSAITSWTSVTASNFPQTNAAANYGIIYGAAYGNGKFVAVGVDGNIVYASEANLQNWTLVTNSTFGTSIIKSISYGGGKFVAVSVDGKMAWSTDGASWTAVADSTFGGTAINSVAYGEGVFVAAGAGGKMAWSGDGVTWNAIAPGSGETDPGDTAFANKDINSICYGDGQFIAVGAYNASSKKSIAGSPDGKNWAAIDSDYNVDIYSVAYGNGTFVAGCYYAFIARSTAE